MEPNSFSAESLYQQAMEAYQAGQLAVAENHLRTILEHQPDHDGIMSTLGGILLASGQTAASLAILQQAIQLNPANPDAYLNIGIAHQQNGQTQPAFDAIQTAAQLAPHRADISYNFANLLLQQQQLPEAIEVLKQVIASEPSFLQAYHTLAAVFHFRQQLAEAQQTYEQALEVVPNDLQTLANLGNLLADTGQTAAATDVFLRATEAHPDHFLGHALLGKLYLDLGENEAGQQALEEAYTLQSNDLNVNILLGNVHKNFGRIDKAEEFYRRALTIQPGDPGALGNLRRILSKKIPYWHFEMLADTARNDAYQQAIERAVTPTTRVLDIGTGSGLLAMMAARAGAENVVACELHEHLAATAQTIVQQNGYGDTINVFPLKSTQLRVGEELDEKVDLVISEILDAGALGEGVLPSIRHARENLAKTDAQLIPAGLKLYGQLLEIPSRSRIAPVREIAGFDLSAFEQYRIPDEYLKIHLKAEKHQMLSPVIPFLAIDFYQLPPAYPDDQAHERLLEFEVTSDGIVQAVAFWFDLQLDETITVSSRPDGELEHWGQALFCFPEPRTVKKGEKVKVSMLQSDNLVRFRLRN